MSYSLERLKKYPAILVTFHEDFKIPKDAIEYAQAVHTLLDKEPKPITVVMDLQAYPLPMEDLLQGTKLAFNPKANITTHPNTAQLVIVSQKPLLKFSIDGFRKMGLAKEIQMVDSLEEAWALL